MESSTNSARRTEDIALDLLKFVAAHANLGAKGSAVTGFAPASSSAAEDQVNKVLELYARCRQAVEAPTAK